MDTFSFLFHLAASNDPSFMQGDNTETLLTVETNRLQWEHVPDPCGDKVAFATGYIMGREGLPREEECPQGANFDFDIGYDRGERVREGASPRPEWDRVSVAS